MPEKVPNKELDEKAAQEMSPTSPIIPKTQPIELEFDEADALFRKRSDV
jgi:hypothetical protein